MLIYILADADENDNLVLSAFASRDGLAAVLNLCKEDLVASVEAPIKQAESSGRSVGVVPGNGAPSIFALEVASLAASSSLLRSGS
jgi:Asp/Glu/hydantoin racemase